MPVIVVINKIDRKDARADEVSNEMFDLFCDLEASDAQTDFPVLYTIATRGIAQARARRRRARTSTPLLRDHPRARAGAARRRRRAAADARSTTSTTTTTSAASRSAASCNGTIAHGPDDRAHARERRSTTRKVAQALRVRGPRARASVERQRGRHRRASPASTRSQIGDTIADPENPEALPRIQVEPPTIKVRFRVNTSPFAGSSRQVGHVAPPARAAGTRDAGSNLALRVEETDEPDTFMVFGRGELMLGVLVETMRREGYEMALGKPEVVVREDRRRSSASRPSASSSTSPEEYVGIVTTSARRAPRAHGEDDEPRLRPRAHRVRRCRRAG